MSSDRTIFREAALAAYRRGASNDVLPRLVSWPIIACAWLLLSLLLATLALAWSIHVPAYAAASGVVAAPDAGRHGSARSAVLFLPPDRAAGVRVGQPVHLRLASSPAKVDGSVATLEPNAIGPDEARRRFPLSAAELVTQPSTVVVVRLAQSLPRVYVGSHVDAQIGTGSQRALSLVPGLGKLMGR